MFRAAQGKERDLFFIAVRLQKNANDGDRMKCGDTCYWNEGSYAGSPIVVGCSTNPMQGGTASGMLNRYISNLWVQGNNTSFRLGCYPQK